MATIILQNTHRPEECEGLNEETLSTPWPVAWKGSVFFCTCPGGQHGGVFAVEADTVDEALALLPPKFRAGTRGVEGMTTEIGSEYIPVA